MMEREILAARGPTNQHAEIVLMNIGKSVAIQRNVAGVHANGGKESANEDRGKFSERMADTAPSGFKACSAGKTEPGRPLLHCP